MNESDQCLYSTKCSVILENNMKSSDVSSDYRLKQTNNMRSSSMIQYPTNAIISTFIFLYNTSRNWLKINGTT